MARVQVTGSTVSERHRSDSSRARAAPNRVGEHSRQRGGGALLKVPTLMRGQPQALLPRQVEVALREHAPRSGDCSVRHSRMFTNKLFTNSCS